MSYEHDDHALDIAKSLGEVIGINNSNTITKDPRFGVNLKVKELWVTSIALSTLEGILPTQNVMIDYDNLPSRCRACFSPKHMVKDCKGFPRQMYKGPRKSGHAHHTH